MSSANPSTRPEQLKTALVAAAAVLAGLVPAPSAALAQGVPTTAATPTSAPTSAPAGSVDWPMFRGDAQLTGVAGGALPEKLAVRWRYELGEGTSSTAAIVAGTVFVGADDGRLTALDLKSGQANWQYEAGDAIQSSPTVAAGLVVCGDETGIVHACEVQTGALRWSFKTGARVISSANTAGDRLVFGSYDGGLYCVQIADGRLIWKYDVGERVHGTPGIAGECVLVAACDGQLHVVRLADGTLVRNVPLGSVSGAATAAHGSRVYVGTYGEQVLGIDWEAGQVVWRFEDPERQFPFLSSAAVTDELVIVGGQDRRVRALEAATGKQRWQFATRGRVDSSPVVSGTRVFFGSADGNLYELDLATGREVWRFEAGGPISASPAVGGGCLVIGTQAGRLYCFAAAADVPPGESQNAQIRAEQPSAQ